MGQVLESFTLTNDNEEVYFVATLGIESETEEGYCLTFGDGYTDGCTSFGHGVSAKILALETYNAVRNLSEFLVEQVKANPVDRISPTQHFWNLFCEEYEEEWLYYNVSSDSIEMSKDGANKLFTFIAKWKTKAEPVGYAKTVIGQSSPSSTLDFEDQNIRLHTSSECGAFQETMTELMTTERGQDAILETFMKSLDEVEAKRDEEKEDAEAEEFFSQLSDPDLARQYYQMMKRQGF